MTKSYKGLNQSLVGELQKSRTKSFSEIERIVDFYCVSVVQPSVFISSEHSNSLWGNYHFSGS